MSDIASQRCARLKGPAHELCSQSGLVTLSVARLFGHRPISIPANVLAYVDLRVASPEEEIDPLLNEHVRVIVLAGPPKGRRPSLPNLLLLFVEPVELPRVRITRRFSVLGGVLHRPQDRIGRTADGVMVTAVEAEEALGLLAGAGAHLVDRPGAWLAEHRAERRDWPLEPLDTPESYLTSMGRLWLAMLPVVIVTIGLYVAPIGILKLLGMVGFGVLVWLRVRWDRLQVSYRRSTLRSGIPEVRGWGLVRAALAQRRET